MHTSNKIFLLLSNDLVTCKCQDKVSKKMGYVILNSEAPKIEPNNSWKVFFYLIFMLKVCKMLCRSFITIFIYFDSLYFLQKKRFPTYVYMGFFLLTTYHLVKFID